MGQRSMPIIYSAVLLFVVLSYQNCGKSYPLGKMLYGLTNPKCTGANCPPVILPSATPATNTEVLPNIKYIGVPQGLSGYLGIASNSVNDLVVSDGKYYIATDKGLSITVDPDAVPLTYTTKTAVDGLAQNRIKAIFTQHRNGQVYIYAGTDSGLSISRDGGSTFERRTTISGLASNIVNGVYAEGQMVYVATDLGLSISNNDGVLYTTKTTAQGLGNNLTYDVIANGLTITVGTLTGLSISINGGISFTSYTNSVLSGAPVRRIQKLSNLTYLATDNGVSSFDPAAFPPVFTNFTQASTPSLLSTAVTDVAANGSKIMVATIDGLFISINSGLDFLRRSTTDGLASNIINSVWWNASDVYVGTAMGLSVSSDSGVTFSTTSNQTEIAQSVILFAGSGLILSSSPDGLFISNDGGLSFFKRTNVEGLGPAYSQIRDIKVDGGFIYAATPAGLAISDDNLGTGTSFTLLDSTSSQLPSSQTNCVAVKGNLLIVGTLNGVAVSMDNGATFTTKDLGSEVFTCGYDEFTNRIWAGTVSDVYLSVDGGANFIPKNIGAFVRSYFFELNRLILATSTGLKVSLDGGENFTNLGAANGLTNISIKSVTAKGPIIFAGGNSGLFVSTNNGQTFTLDTENEGLADISITGLGLNNNYLFIGTQAGLNRSRNPY